METISEIILYKKDLIPEKNRQSLEPTLNSSSPGEPPSYDLHIITDNQNDIYNFSLDGTETLGEKVVEHIKSKYIIWSDYTLLFKKPDGIIDRTTERFRYDIEAAINSYIHESMKPFDEIPDKEPAESVPSLVLDA